MAGRHTRRIVAITGGASGIGQSIVQRLEGEGARVAIADIADAAETADLARRAGSEAAAFRIDIANWEQMSDFADQERTRFATPLSSFTAPHCSS